MQISSGDVKGAQLRAPSRYSTRPVTSTVRQAIFSILNNIASDWERILDLYAGSGSLGIEALSRRAGWADFVDQNRKCCDVIKHNLQKTGTLHRAHIYCCGVNKAIGFLSGSYGVVFVDPPYSNSSADLLARLAESEIVGEDSTVVVCHANRFPLEDSYDRLRLVKERRYGDTFISIYQKEN